MPKIFDGRYFWLWWLAIVVFLDQMTKILVLKNFVFGISYQVLAVLNIVITYNTGVAFSIFGGSNTLWHTWLLIVLALVISMFIILWLFRLDSKKYITKTALALVLGGALSNLLDRIRYGYVIDFIDMHIHNLHWPVFNVADIAISLGVVILLFEMTVVRRLG